MKDLKEVFSAIPDPLKDALISEYQLISQNYFERKWLASELHGGRFCEVLYNVLLGIHSGSYPTSITKPKNFVEACRVLESNSKVPRSFQILIPRILPALYEIRNNRNVGHVGGDVESNSMDANFVFSTVSWIMGELVRFYHKLAPAEAQTLVDRLTERKIPFIWISGDVKRVLNPKMSKKLQLLILLCNTPTEDVKVSDIQNWIEYKNKSDFIKLLKSMHKARYIEFDQGKSIIKVLPPGIELASTEAKKFNGIL